MAEKRRPILVYCEREEPVPQNHVTTVDFEGVLKCSIEYEPTRLQDYLEKCFRALMRERFHEEWTKATLKVGLYDEFLGEDPPGTDRHNLAAGFYCDPENQNPVSLDTYMELSEPLWNKEPSRQKLSKNIAAKMESYIRCSL